VETRFFQAGAHARRGSSRGRPLRAFAAWASPPPASQDTCSSAQSAAPVKPPKPSRAARSAAAAARLRAMVEAVEHWPLSERLLEAIEQLADEGPASDDAHEPGSRHS
jgi:hypothetical protein